MDDILRVASTTLHEDQNNMVVWLHFDEDTARLSTEGKSARRRLINEYIRAIWDAQVPTGEEKYALANPRPDPRGRTFFEQGNDLSAIFWLARPEQ